MGFKTEEEALRSLVYFVGLIEIMWNKMLEVELFMLFKSEYSIQSPFGKIASKIFPQCFKNRGLSYLNIINKFQDMLTNLTNKQKKSLSKIVHDEAKKIKGIKRVVKGKQEDSAKICRENFKALRDYFKGDQENIAGIQNLEQSFNCQIEHQEKKKREIYESQLKQLKQENEQLRRLLNQIKVLHQNQLTKVKETAQQQIDQLISEQQKLKQENDSSSSLQLYELKTNLNLQKTNLKTKKNYLKRSKKRQMKSPKRQSIQNHPAQIKKYLNKATSRCNKIQPFQRTRKNQTQSDLARWKKDALALQEKLEKSEKQSQAGIKLAKQVPDIERLKSQILFLQKEKQIEKEIMNAEYQNLMKEVNEIKSVIGANRSYIARLEQQIRTRDSQIKILRETLRSFTSCKDMDFDQTFEAVLKAQFDVMKSSFLKQINQLNKIIEEQGKDYQIKLRDAEKQKQELKIKISSLSSRISYFKNAATDSKN